jgi:hypothetical protein
MKSPAKQCWVVAEVEQRMTFVNALKTQLPASRAIATNLLNVPVAELTAP